MEKIKPIETLSRVVKADNSLDPNRNYYISANIEVQGSRVTALRNGKVFSIPAGQSESWELAGFDRVLPDCMTLFVTAACDRAALFAAVEEFVAAAINMDIQALKLS